MNHSYNCFSSFSLISYDVIGYGWVWFVFCVYFCFVIFNHYNNIISLTDVTSIDSFNRSNRLNEVCYTISYLLMAKDVKLHSPYHIL